MTGHAACGCCALRADRLLLVANRPSRTTAHWKSIGYREAETDDRQVTPAEKPSILALLPSNARSAPKKWDFC